jgi:hypothetical protein
MQAQLTKIIERIQYLKGLIGLSNMDQAYLEEIFELDKEASVLTVKISDQVHYAQVPQNPQPQYEFNPHNINEMIDEEENVVDDLLIAEQMEIDQINEEIDMEIEEKNEEFFQVYLDPNAIGSATGRKMKRILKELMILNAKKF